MRMISVWQNYLKLPASFSQKLLNSMHCFLPEIFGRLMGVLGI